MIRNLYAPLFVLTLFSLWGCAPVTLNPYPVAVSSEASSGGAPTMRPLPTLPGGTPNPYYSYYATPNPAEKVEVNVVETVLPTPLEQSYTLENTRLSLTQSVLYLVDTETQQRFRLGDDSGNARFQGASNKTLLWFFACQPCPTLAAGLYAHSLDTHQDTFVSERVISYLGAVQITEPWVIYMTSLQSRRNSAQLYAYNLETEETRLVAKNVFLHPSNPQSYLAINEEMIAWTEASEDRPWPAAVHVYDLTTQVDRKLDVEVNDIRKLAVSRNLVVWWDIFWKGYDLNNNALFTLPIRNELWGDKPITAEGPFQPTGRQIQWTLESNGEDHTFLGTVELKTP